LVDDANVWLVASVWMGLALRAELQGRLRGARLGLL